MSTKFYALSLVASALVLSNAEGAGDMRRGQSGGTCENSCCDNDSCCGECCCMPQPNQCLNAWGYAPPYYDLNCAWGVSISAEFLYWYGREFDLATGARLLLVEQQSNDVTAQTAFPALNEVLYPKAKWDPGVRLSVGWNPNCDGWDAELSWTYYKNERASRVCVPSFDPLFINNNAGTSLLSNVWTDSITFFDFISSRWELEYNQLDLVLGRRYWLSPCFTLRPFVGLRALWSDISLDACNTADYTDDSSLSFPFSHCNEYWGVGLVGGLSPRFYFTPCFSLYGEMAFALAWGEFQIKRANSRATSTPNNTPPPDVVTTSLMYRSCSECSGMQSVLDLALGLRYETTFCDRSYLGYLETGWEHHLLINHVVRFRSLLDGLEFDQVKNDIGFGGFVLKAGFEF